MIIIPAIDLKSGKCVRLRQGKMDFCTVFSEQPATQAMQWEELGATRIHVVDLDGSTGGRPLNLGSVKEIVEAVRVPIQLGGGIRNETTIRMYLDLGVETVILGTLAARTPDLAVEFMSLFPGKIAVGIDAKAGLVAVEGWTESTNVKASELAAYLDRGAPSCYIYTDIEKDGMMQGPNISATTEFAGSTPTPVILSGGVSAPSDIDSILPLEKDGVIGIIIGRALYEGTIDLQEAIRLAEKRNAGKKNHSVPGR
jgi:phosphoribosylformimino-5-aminoimidazole carboxamide ribotide isomerase